MGWDIPTIDHAQYPTIAHKNDRRSGLFLLKQIDSIA